MKFLLFLHLLILALSISPPRASGTTSAMGIPTATSAGSVTTSSFTANWDSVHGAEGYILDVATDSGFNSYLPGYQNLNVSNVTSYHINSGLEAGGTYHYRVRAQMGNGLDTTFNGTGVAVHNSAAGGNGNDNGNSITIDDNGNILVTGGSCRSVFSGNCTKSDMALWRLNSDGILDTTFNGKGYTTSDSGTSSGSSDIKLDASGQIVVAGSRVFINTYGYLGTALWRYNTDGTRDATFMDTSVASERGNSLVIDSSGRIVVTGFGWNGSNQDMALWRWTSTGFKDYDFNYPSGYLLSNGVAGKTTGKDSGNGIIIDANGKILVTGYSTGRLGDYDMVVWRYNANGSLDTSFNYPKGYVVDNGAAGRSDGPDYGNAITIDADGKILVTGSSTNQAGNKDMVIWRFNPDGSLDTSFNGTGIAVNYNAAGGNGEDSGSSITIDAYGNILVTGYSRNAAGNNDMVIWRFNPDGSLDTSFNGTGIAVHNNAAGGNEEDSGNSITTDAYGMILVAGFNTNTSGNSDMVVWRYRPGWTSADSNSIAVTVPDIPNYSLGVTVTGQGTVHSTPGTDMQCTGGCVQGYVEGTNVTLTADPDINYSFIGWAGDCTGTSDCTVTMDAGKNVSATFSIINTSHPFILESTQSGYPSIQKAYNNIGSSDVIKVKASYSITEALVLDRGVTVRFEGGYDEIFARIESATILNGSLTISSGQVFVSNIIIR